MDKKTKDFFISIAMLGGFVLFCICFFYAASGSPKAEATADSVWSILESQGYEPYDSTQEYADKYALKVVSVKENDIDFNFFVFYDSETTEQVRGEYISYIRTNRFGYPKREIREGARNYMIYTLKAKGLYSVNIKVGNTLIVAFSDEENAGKINKIISEMDYFKQ